MKSKSITLSLNRSDFELLVTAVNRYWSDAHHAENLEEQKLTSIMNNRGI